MTGDPVLVLGWLVLAHLVADFVLQTDTMVADKSASPGRRRWRGLLAHGLMVAGCLVPAVVVFGLAGLWALLLITLSHVAIDRWKVRATRHAEAQALSDAHRRQRPAADVIAAPSPGPGRGSTDGLGPGWTPIPAALFVLDQVLHGVAIVVAWAVFLAGVAPLPAVAEVVDRLAGGWDRAMLHGVALGSVVAVSLVIVNVRAGAFFVATLVRPREAVEGLAMPAEPGTSVPVVHGWRVRLGPLEAVAEPHSGLPGSSPGPGGSVAASPGRIGATIGVLERLLIVTFVLSGTEVAIGLVVAAKTLARFRQLDDRDFAEYYLLGTLASVAVAVASGMIGAAALRTIG